MAIEWLAIAAALTPHIKKYAKERAEKLATKYADGAFSKIYHRIVPDEKLVRANEAFVSRFAKELDSCIDLATLTAKPYQKALTEFLENPSVQDALLAPLDGHSELDSTLLRGIWSELRLIDLPVDFDWAKVAKTYRHSIAKQMLADPALRPVVAALAGIRTAEATERSAAALDRLAGPPRSFNLERYAAALKTAYAYLKLGSIDTDWADYQQRVRLENVYVPQSVKQALPPRDLTRDYLRTLKEEGRTHDLDPDGEQLDRRKQEYAELASRALLNVVDDPAHERLVILGDPGLGKSTLLKHLALRWAEDPARPLALFIELRRASGFASFLKYLENGPDRTCSLPEWQLHEYLTNNASLVLFDGLDEVIELARPDTVSGIIRFAGDYPKARIIVTTRIHGYYPGSTHPDRFRDAGFRQFTLQDFDEPEIGRFIRLWHEEAFRDPAERTRYESRMRKSIGDSPAIRELAANPLLLTMMAILSRNQDLPRDRNKLYERCAELLLKNWDLEKFPELKEKKDARDIKDKLGPDQKMRVLERVAAAMQQERTGLAGNLISEDKLRQIVQAELTQLGVPQPGFVAEDLIWMLRERNFMLAYLGDRQYAFVHRTFLEYFCARDLKHRLEKTSTLTVDDLRAVFRERWAQDEWHEVLRLLCGIIGAEYAAQCVSELLAQETQPDGDGAVFLAAECLQEIRELGWLREIRTQARERLTALSQSVLPNPEDPGYRTAVMVHIRAMRELARGWRDDYGTLPWLKDRAAHDASVDVRQVAVQELARGWRDDPATLPWLKDRAAHDLHPSVRRMAVQVLAQGWKDDPDTLPWLKDRAARDDYYDDVRQTAVRELARGWKDDPDTLPWLKGRAAHDDHSVVRQTAVQELARGWKDDSATLPLLKDRAARDDRWAVRQTAVQELARGWKDDPDTLPFLKDRAARDDHWMVRLIAVRMLALRWKDDPDTLLLLKDRARDDNEYVRRGMVQELARGWKDDPATLPLLKDRAARDDHEDVRQAAVEELARGWKDDPAVQEFLEDLRKSGAETET